MKSRAERGHHRSGLMQRHPAVGVMDAGGCPVTPVSSPEQPATCGELLGVCCTSQDHSQHSRSHAGDLGRGRSLPSWLDWHHCSVRLGPRGAASQKALAPVTWVVTSHGAERALKLSQLSRELGDRSRVCPASRTETGTEMLGHCLQTSCWYR